MCTASAFGCVAHRVWRNPRESLHTRPATHLRDAVQVFCTERILPAAEKEHLFCYTLEVFPYPSPLPKWGKGQVLPRSGGVRGGGLENKMLKILPFHPTNQASAKALILSGLEEHWGFLDESKNPDLDNIALSYADATFLAAWLNDEIIGTGAFIPRSKSQVEIVRMSVKKDLRRQGIGQQILAELCKRASQDGYEEVILETTATWQDVIDFYLQYGFEITHYEGGDVYFKLKLC